MFEVLGAVHNKSSQSTKRVAVDNLVFDDDAGWQSKNSKKQPRVTLEVDVDSTAYAKVRYKCPIIRKTMH